MITVEQLYEKLKPIRVGSPLCEFTLEHCQRIHPVISRIEELKREKNAIILAHNYVAPEILYGVADHTGDSYGLAKIARDSDAEVIVFPAVRFMAETAKILNPDKTVIGQVQKGFSFLGYWLSPKGVGVSKQSIHCCLANIGRLYGRGATLKRIDQYWRNWLRWVIREC